MACRKKLIEALQSNDRSALASFQTSRNDSRGLGEKATSESAGETLQLEGVVCMHPLYKQEADAVLSAPHLLNMRADQVLAAGKGATMGSMRQHGLSDNLAWADSADLLRTLMGEGLLSPEEYRAISAIFQQQLRKQAQQQ
jgi:hypothetical protein